MTCDRARTLMLEADPAELRGDGYGPGLAAHVAACPDCAHLAATILRSSGTLNEALTALATPRAHTPKRRPWRRIAALVPLAAAAGLALFLWRAPGPLPPRPALPGVPHTIEVNAGGNGGVAVMQTRNPDITVVWTF